MAGNKSSELPPGFRFHPTDEELIMYYLRNQATSRACPAAIIPEVDIYKFDPWELPENRNEGKEWYFFTPRDRKYPNGVRPNRAAVSGYWKATGTDKSIYSGSKYVGIKKALVFYKGRPPKGAKTDWIMHEYRLSDSRSQPTISQNGSMRLDDWVLCRIYKKKNHGKALDIKIEENQRGENMGCNLVINEQQQQQQQQQQEAFKIARQCSLSHLWELEYMESMSHIFPEYSYNNTNFEQQNMVGNINYGNGNNSVIPRQHGEMPNQTSSLLNQQQPVYMNHDFDFQ